MSSSAREKRERTGLDLTENRLETVADRAHILLRQDAGFREHGRMREGAPDVLGREPLVEVDGGVDLLHDLGGPGFETAAPHPIAHA